MSLIEEILTELKAKHGYTKFEIEKIIDSQYKVMLDCMQAKDLRTVNVMYIGKFKPTYYLKKRLYEVPKESQEHSCGMEECNLPNTGDREDGVRES